MLEGFEIVENIERVLLISSDLAILQESKDSPGSLN